MKPQSLSNILRKACELAYAPTRPLENPICSHFPADARRYRADKASNSADHSRQDNRQESSHNPLVVHESSEIVRAAGSKPSNETLSLLHFPKVQLGEVLWV